MDKTTFQCPACKKVHFARPELAGEHFRCTCGQMLVGPEVTAAGASTPYDLVPEWEPEGGKKPRRVTKVAVPQQAPQPAAEEQVDYAPPRKKKQSETDKWGPRRQGDDQPHFDRDAEFAKAASRSAALQWTIVVVIFLALSLGLMWSIMRRAQGPGGGLLKGDDAEVAGQTAAWGATDLTTWLKPGSTNHVDGLKDDEARAVAKKWYEMGAVKVLAFGTGPVDELAIELPDDPAKRAALFEWNKRFMQANHKEAQTDIGQHYLLIKIHP